jgi:hypothetical protein
MQLAVAHCSPDTRSSDPPDCVGPRRPVQAAVDDYSACLALDSSRDNPGFASKLYCNRAAAQAK